MANPSVRASSISTAESRPQPAIGAQQALVADVGAVTTVGDNTGTAAAGLSLIGDTSSVDQAAALMNDFASIQEDLAALRTAVNAALDVLEAHGLMADA